MSRRSAGPRLVRHLLLPSLLVLASPAAAQRTETVTPSERYRARGGMHELFLGEEYRALWTTPVRVEVLDPERFAGGLTVLQEGGGLSTESLRLKGADGREYVFRSVDKDVTPALPEDLHGTAAAWVVQDQVAAKHPAAALVVPPLLEAVGVLHAVPRMYVMPDHPFLGEHREFAGRLGQLEVRPTDGDDGPAFAGAEDIEGTDDLFDELEEDPEDRVDERAFLTARLMDVLVGDWDRHMDQWRWARYDAGGLKVWRPIPRDRDNAFVRHEGIVMRLAKTVAPQLTTFGPRIDEVFGLTIHGSTLDRRLLTRLERPVWDSVAQFVRTRLTDQVIDAAVRRLPPEHYALSGELLARELRARRDQLPAAATAWYDILSTEVDVRATDEAEVAQVVRNPDGSVDVVIFTADAGDGIDARRPHFRRRFLPDETREVRLFLHGGDDRAEVSGQAGESVLVRVIGGGGDDSFVDRSVASGGRRTVFYDDRGENRFEPGREAKVDTRPYEAPVQETLVGNAPPPRDWGSASSFLTPWGTWTPNVGPELAFGPSWTRYGFRRFPYASFVHARVLWAPLADGLFGRHSFGAELFADFHRTNRPTRTEVHVRGSTFETRRFHGFGNDTPDAEESEDVLVRHDQLRGHVLLVTRPAPGWELALGPSAKWTDADREPGSFAEVLEPRGAYAFFQAGALGRARFDGRDDAVYPRSGLFALTEAAAYGSDMGGAFGRVRGEGRGYLPLGADSLGPVVAVRAGAEHALGDFPFQEAAYVGGPATVRGYPHQRFVGETGVWGGAEFRTRLTRAKLLVHGDLGVFALADVGRVYVEGESEGGWHTGVGGGLWFRTVGRIVGLTYAYGDSHQLYLHVGMPF